MLRYKIEKCFMVAAPSGLSNVIQTDDMKTADKAKSIAGVRMSFAPVESKNTHPHREDTTILETMNDNYICKCPQCRRHWLGLACTPS